MRKKGLIITKVLEAVAGAVGWLNPLIQLIESSITKARIRKIGDCGRAAGFKSNKVTPNKDKYCREKKLPALPAAFPPGMPGALLDQ
jgi:hypothetical protein